jgi:opacity protein-like surface antigen
MSRAYLLSGVAAVAAAVFFTSPAVAADIEEPVVERNWYVSIHGGWKFGEDWDDHASGEKKKTFCVPPPPKEVLEIAELIVPILYPHKGECTENEERYYWKEVEVTYQVDKESTISTDGGPRAGGAIGYMLNDMFALEGEFGWMSQDFDHESGEITKTVIDVEPYVHGFYPPDKVKEIDRDLDGDVDIFTLMVNAPPGVPIGASSVRPYVGAGIGVAFVSFDDLGTAGGGHCCLDDDDTVLAFQAFAGVDFGLTEHISLGIRGRVLHIDDVDLEDDFGFEHDLGADLIPSVEGVLTFVF